jgi:hypothetical protein
MTLEVVIPSGVGETTNENPAPETLAIRVSLIVLDIRGHRGVFQLLLIEMGRFLQPIA